MKRSGTRGILFIVTDDRLVEESATSARQIKSLSDYPITIVTDSEPRCGSQSDEASTCSVSCILTGPRSFFGSATFAGPPDVPVVVTLHRDVFIPTADSGLPGRVIDDVTAWALDATLFSGALDVLTVHSDDIRDRIVEAVSSATTANVRTIPAPTPEPTVTSDVDSLRTELNLPDSRDLLLFFGGLRHEKGSDVLVEQLRRLDRQLTVVFAGSPVDSSASDLDDWRETVGAGVDIIDRLNYVPEEQMDEYFAVADVTVLPYRRSRGISGPLRRSAMAGTPVVGTTETDVGRLIERHRLGATFDPDDGATFSRALEQTLDAGSALRTALESFALSRHWERLARFLPTSTRRC